MADFLKWMLGPAAGGRPPRMGYLELPKDVVECAIAGISRIHDPTDNGRS